ncbi:TPA: aspartate--tRNA(Asn) ligase [Candidatus Micrarchaeota archaeon]|nr:aspartate--tRNA(Asn) ligase [Candidatus Micrarchaeota archaeon]
MRIYVSDAKKEKGKSVLISGWVHEVRDIGKMKFVIVRDQSGTMQVTLKKGVVPDAVFDSVSVNREDVVSFEGEVKENKIAPDGVELVPISFQLLGKVERKLPVDPSGVVPSELDTRLDHRYVDLRNPRVLNIFKAKSVLANSFREKLLELGFTEIHPPSITGAATEGGTDVFPIAYFENKAYLVQSPQLYKQLAVIGGLDRVFMTTPVFRAEKHNTTTHLNEVVQMDIEMGFADHQIAMDYLEIVVLHMLHKLGALAPAQVIRRHTYSSLVEELNRHGFKMEWGEDFSKEAEKRISEILGEDLYFIYDWPTKARAFYSMPSEKDPEICHAFDLIYKGLEIASGAQRIHKVDLLEKQLQSRGLDPHKFEFYLNAFRMGAPPHAGWSIGLERITMKATNQDNIRECVLFPRDRVRLSP